MRLGVANYFVVSMKWISVIRIREDRCDVADAGESYGVMRGMSCDSSSEMWCVKHLFGTSASIQLRLVKVSHISSLMEHMIYKRFIFLFS